MYVDKELVVWDAVALDADAVSTNFIDLGNVTPKIDIGGGQPMCFVLQVDVSADHTTGNETFEFQILQDAASDGNTADVLVKFPFTYDQLTAGIAPKILPVPPGFVTKRYLGLKHDGTGTTPTITVTAFLTMMNMVDALKIYAKGFVIS